MQSKAEQFASRLNKISRLSEFKSLPKRLTIVEEFDAVRCSHDYTRFRVDNEMVELKNGKYQVR